LLHVTVFRTDTGHSPFAFSLGQALTFQFSPSRIFTRKVYIKKKKAKTENDISEPSWNYRKFQSNEAQAFQTTLQGCDFPEGPDKAKALEIILFKVPEVVAAQARSSSSALAQPSSVLKLQAVPITLTFYPHCVFYLHLPLQLDHCCTCRYHTPARVGLRLPAHQPCKS